MSEGDATLFDGLAASCDDWYETPLGALGDVLEQKAVFALAGEVEGWLALALWLPSARHIAATSAKCLC